ncbi:lytic murein transglycosylase, partial [Vibrio parahaemolyticus]|nr:lytic murein transglycosylase [Vibrio parahaemolyticus]
AWLIMPDDENGRTYLVYNNYNVLMKWNRSYYFALAVSHLADRIKY